MTDSLGVGAMAGVVSDMGPVCTSSRQQVCASAAPEALSMLCETQYFAELWSEMVERSVFWSLTFPREVQLVLDVDPVGMRAVSEHHPAGWPWKDCGGVHRAHVCCDAARQTEGWRLELPSCL